MYLFAKDAIFKEITSKMGDDDVYKFSKRIKIWKDSEIFNYKEDAFVWGQKKEKIPNYYTIYFDDVFICGFGEDELKEKVLLSWWKGLRDQIKAGNLDLDPVKSAQLKQDKEDRLKELEKEKQKSIEQLPADDPIRKMAKEVVKNANASNSTSRSNTRRKKSNA